MSVSTLAERGVLGSTDLRVSPLAYGAMELRGPYALSPTLLPRNVSEATAGRVLNAALDFGINFIDTSPDYGLSEDRIGRHLAGRRDEFILATKCGCVPKVVGDEVVSSHEWSAGTVRRNVRNSLITMSTDRLDLLQLHGGTPREVIDGGVVDELLRLKSAGDVRYLGVSTKQADDLLGFLATGLFDVFQVPYSCLDPELLPVIEQIAASGAGLIVRGGVSRRALVHDIGSEYPDLWDRAELDAVLPQGMSRDELILRDSILVAGPGVVLAGTARVEHLAANVEFTTRGPLDLELHREIARRVRSAQSVQERNIRSGR